MADKNFQASVQLILQTSLAGRPHHEHVLSLGATPAYLIEHAGFPALDLVIKGSAVDKAHFDHGIPKSMLYRLADIIASPKALYRSATIQSSAVVITFEVKDGAPILIPLHANKLVGRSHVNVVASVYNKEATVEQRWANAGLKLWSK